MQRRYDVYMEGRPVVITDALPATVLGPGWQQLMVRGEADLEEALDSFTQDTGPEGLWLYSGDGVDLWELFRARFKFVQAAGGVVVDEQSRVLTIKRLGMWDLPKGKVEKGESIPDAAVREVSEECGIQQLQLLHPLAVTWHTYERKGRQHLKRTDWFLMQGTASEALVPQHEEDIEEVRWLSGAEADPVLSATYPSLLPVFRAWLALL